MAKTIWCPYLSSFKKHNSSHSCIWLMWPLRVRDSSTSVTLIEGPCGDLSGFPTHEARVRGKTCSHRPYFVFWQFSCWLLLYPTLTPPKHLFPRMLNKPFKTIFPLVLGPLSPGEMGLGWAQGACWGLPGHMWSRCLVVYQGLRLLHCQEWKLSGEYRLVLWTVVTTSPLQFLWVCLPCC